MNNEKVALAALLLFGAALLATGFNDLDWMLVSYKFQLGQAVALNLTWQFTPFFVLDWWVAYVFSLLRVVIGSFLLGLASCFLVRR